jgi:stress response protein YsnF
MAQRSERTEALPVVEERIRVGKRKIETGRVRITTRQRQKSQAVREQLLHEDVEVERVSVNRFAETAPEMRKEGDILVIPVFEEVLVKRIFVREELRVSRKRNISQVDDVVRLRSQEVVVDRTGRG